MVKFLNWLVCVAATAVVLITGATIVFLIGDLIPFPFNLLLMISAIIGTIIWAEMEDL